MSQMARQAFTASPAEARPARLPGILYLLRKPPETEGRKAKGTKIRDGPLRRAHRKGTRAERKGPPPVMSARLPVLFASALLRFQ